MTSPLPPGSSIAVVGAGIIGVSAAFVLRERGYEVTLIDRAAPGRTGPSFGNAGHVVGSGIFPLGTPGIGITGMRMLLDPDGPLKLPTAYARQMMPWLWRFWRSSYGPAYEHILATLIEFNRNVIEDTEALYASAGMSHLIKRAPALYLYESAASYQAARKDWALRAQHGYESTAVDAAQIKELEPHLAPIFPHGVISHEWAIVTDPIEAVDALFAAGHGRGVVFEEAAVAALRNAGDGVELLIAGQARRFDAALVSAGVWSKPLARSLGETLMVEAERGYNLTFPGQQAKTSRPLVLADRGVVATSLTPGLRIGGWTELGGTALPPNPSRWKKMREISEAIVPGLGTAEAMEWMGHRPSTPDSIPVISRSTNSDRVFYAVGHGHYGLSQAAKTAKMIGEIVGDSADERYAAHSIDRFN